MRKGKIIIFGFVFLVFLLATTPLVFGWYGTYLYRRDITNEGTQDIALAVNSTSGFCGNIIWTNAHYQGDASIYYDNCNDYAVVINDSIEANYETEGGGLNNSISSIYSAIRVYHFGTNSTDVFDSSGNQNGTTNATWTSAGFYGAGLVFDGTYNELTPSLHLNETKNWTITGWFKSNATNDYMAFFGEWEGAIVVGNDYGAILRTNGTGSNFVLVTGLNDVPSTYTITKPEINNGSWHLVAWTFNTDTNEHKIYFDGTLAGSTTADFNYLNGNYGLAIGNYVSGSTQNKGWNGSIDEIRIYDRILSLAEISELYNNSKTGLAGSMDLSSESLNIINWTFPQDDSQFNQDYLQFNFTIRQTPLNCSLNWGQDINYTVSSQELGMWHRFTDNASDFSGNGNDGQAIGGATHTRYWYDFDGAVGSYIKINQSPTIALEDEWTVMMWIKPFKTYTTGEPSAWHHFIKTSAIAETGYPAFEFGYQGYTDDLTFKVFNRTGGNSAIHGTSTIEKDKWLFIAGVVLPNGTFKLYEDGTEVGSGFLEGINSSGYDFYYLVGSAWNGSIDEVTLYTRALNSSEIFSIYNFTKQFYKNTLYNLNSNTTTYQFNLSYLNDTEAYFSYNITCWNSTLNSTTETRTILVDLITPNLFFDSYSQQNLHTILFNQQFNFTINATDPNLYSLNITDDEGYFSYYNNSLTGLSNISFTFSVNTTNHSWGEHYIYAEVCDGHTTRKIPKFKTIKNLFTKEMKYQFDKKNYLKIKPSSLFDFADVGTRKLEDRYTFQFLPRRRTTRYSFIIESNDEIDIVNSKYKGHLVLPHSKKWIDFENEDVAKVDVQRLGKRKVKVIVYLKKQPSGILEFKSVGNLNCENKTFYWQKINYTIDYSQDVIETTQQYFNLTIKYLPYGTNHSMINGFNADFIWNGTSYSPTEQAVNSTMLIEYKQLDMPWINSSSNETINLSFNLSADLQNYGATNEENSGLLTQTIYRMQLDNCSNLSTRAINISVRDEVNDSLLTSNLEGLFTIWARENYERNYGIESANLQTHGICIYPSFANLTSNFEILYSSSGYNSRTYAKQHYVLDNQTDNTTLYLIAEGQGTEITFTITDEYGTEVEGAIVEAWLYDLSENSYSLVGSEVTDASGIAKITLLTGDNKYQFKVYYNGELKYTSSTSKLFDTSYSFQIILGESYESITIGLSSIERTLTQNGSVVTFSWNDATGFADEIKLIISNSTDTLYNATFSNSSGQVSYELNGSSYYTASAYAVINGIDYFLESINIDKREIKSIFGNESLLIGGLYILGAFFVGFVISAEAGIIFTIASLILFEILGIIHLSAGATANGLIAMVCGLIIILINIKRRGEI